MELTEFEEQKLLIQWFDLQYKNKYVFFSVPNGLYTKNLIIAKKAKATGLRNGVPDLFLAVSRQGYHGLFIEMKRLKSGYVSQPQKEMIARIELAGYKCEICKGFEAAKHVIEEYLK